MAAGQGFKNFNTGDVLTSSDVNGYLMQGVWVFANAAARTSAVTSPQEGNVSFLKDTNSFEIYDGAAWVAYGSGDITGVTAGTGISGGGTAGDVTITNTMATAIDAKGDLIAGTGADTFSRLAVGSNNQVLTADSATTTGLKWATPSSGAMTSLASGTLNSGTAQTSVNVTTTGYIDLYILLYNVTANNPFAYNLYFNNYTTGTHQTIGNYQVAATNNLVNLSARNSFEVTGGLGGIEGTAGANSFYTYLFDCQNTSTTYPKVARSNWTGVRNSDSALIVGQMTHRSAGIGAITSVQFNCSGGNFNGGSYIIYGVK